MARSPPWRRAAALRLNHRTPAHTAAQGGGQKLSVCAGTAQNMFYNARAFNQPLAAWDVGQVTDMQVCRCPAFGSGARAHTQLLRGAATSRVRVLAWRRACSPGRALSTSPWKLGTSARLRTCRFAAALRRGHRAPAHAQLCSGERPQAVCVCWRGAGHVPHGDLFQPAFGSLGRWPGYSHGGAPLPCVRIRGSCAHTAA